MRTTIIVLNKKKGFAVSCRSVQLDNYYTRTRFKYFHPTFKNIFIINKELMTSVDNTCHICMEHKQSRGNVVLKCAHEMCAECFAKHSRTNHTCPFCRTPFAPQLAPKERTRVPFHVVERVIHDHLLSETDFYYELNRRINWEIEPKYQVAILRAAIGNICLDAMDLIKRWYDARREDDDP